MNLPMRDSAADLSQLRIAIVHEWFVNHAGSEKVVQEMLEVFPQADLFALVDFLPEGRRGYLKNKPVKTSFIQKMPFAQRHFRNYFPLFPLAVEGHDLRGYDLIISSSHMVSKGILTQAGQLHICYCHSPCRFAWDLYHQYLEEAGLHSGIKGFLTQYFLHRLRNWDILSLPRVGHFIANSEYIGRRIRHVYQRESRVVYPPVSVEKFTLREAKQTYYFAASRLVPYKKMDVIVEAFNRMPDLSLVLVGSGPDSQNLKSRSGPNIRFLTEANSEEFIELMQGARAFVFAAEEDFGITMAEALACGTPVLAFGKGGACEIVEEGRSGYLFPFQSSESVMECVRKFEDKGLEWSPARISQAAARFSRERFRVEWKTLVEKLWLQRES
jgi:glycosyltransferase involved in cell wall biosynthesis